MRKTIAKRLSSSKFSAPHYYLGVEFDMENTISLEISLILYLRPKYLLTTL